MFLGFCVKFSHTLDGHGRGFYSVRSLGELSWLSAAFFTFSCAACEASTHIFSDQCIYIMDYVEAQIGYMKGFGESNFYIKNIVVFFINML